MFSRAKLQLKSIHHASNQFVTFNFFVLSKIWRWHF